MDDESRSLSRPRPPQTTSTDFVRLKRDLAVVLLLVAVLALIIAGMRFSRLTEVAALAATGVAAGAWVIWRTRRAERRSRRIYADRRRQQGSAAGTNGVRHGKE